MNGFVSRTKPLILRDHALMPAYSHMMAQKVADGALYQRRIADYRLQTMRGDKLAMHHPTGEGLNANVSACLLIDAQ
ncbi:hypothetical protein FDV58_40750 [Bradyrhizobium elkanii]|uniref:Uncharacterized protein n=1 Tax=Bradyrhizobium elkanii TaxID=29448 RepID=A0A4U6RE46_BRAEL|nr:hypothetical protein FDV58_40750 [Bradyrhizobium elkanii]